MTIYIQKALRLIEKYFKWLILGFNPLNLKIKDVNPIYKIC